MKVEFKKINTKEYYTWSELRDRDIVRSESGHWYLVCKSLGATALIGFEEGRGYAGDSIIRDTKLFYKMQKGDSLTLTKD